VDLFSAWLKISKQDANNGNFQPTKCLINSGHVLNTAHNGHKWANSQKRPIKHWWKRQLTAMMNVMVTTAELDMTRALFGSKAMRDGSRDSASTSNLIFRRFEM